MVLPEVNISVLCQMARKQNAEKRINKLNYHASKTGAINETQQPTATSQARSAVSAGNRHVRHAFSGMRICILSRN